MNSRYVVKLFLNTLLIGGITSGIVGLIVQWDKFGSNGIGSLIAGFIWLVGVGLIFSVVSQMAFFAYLTIHRIALGVFKSASVWNIVQVLTTIVVLVDLAYVRHLVFAEEGSSWLPFIVYPVILLIVAVIVAVFKSKQTNKQAFIPAVFFMVVLTVIEWYPALRINDQNWLDLMLIPLLVCNAYQLLILPIYNEKSQIERKNVKARNTKKTVRPI